MASITKQILISAQTVFDITGLNQEVDEKLINAHILTAQELYLESLLGSKLYQAVLNGNYNSLLTNYIYQVLAWYAVVEALPLIHTRIGNGGVFNNSPEAAQIAQNSTLSVMKEWANSKANEYAERMIKEISLNSYPEYRSSESDEVQSSEDQMFGNFLL